MFPEGFKGIGLVRPPERQRILANSIDKAARAELRKTRKKPAKITKSGRGVQSRTEVARERWPAL